MRALLIGVRRALKNRDLHRENHGFYRENHGFYRENDGFYREYPWFSIGKMMIYMMCV